MDYKSFEGIKIALYDKMYEQRLRKWLRMKPTHRQNVHSKIFARDFETEKFWKFISQLRRVKSLLRFIFPKQWRRSRGTDSTWESEDRWLLRNSLVCVGCFAPKRSCAPTRKVIVWVSKASVADKDWVAETFCLTPLFNSTTTGVESSSRWTSDLFVNQRGSHRS